MEQLYICSCLYSVKAVYNNILFLFCMQIRGTFYWYSSFKIYIIILKNKLPLWLSNIIWLLVNTVQCTQYRCWYMFICVCTLSEKISYISNIIFIGTVSRDFWHFYIKKLYLGPIWTGKIDFAKFFVFVKIFAKTKCVRIRIRVHAIFELKIEYLRENLKFAKPF